jgi:hypothetical protein
MSGLCFGKSRALRGHTRRGLAATSRADGRQSYALETDWHPLDALETTNSSLMRINFSLSLCSRPVLHATPRARERLGYSRPVIRVRDYQATNRRLDLRRHTRVRSGTSVALPGIRPNGL